MDFNLVDQFNRLLSHVIPESNIVQLTNKIMEKFSQLQIMYLYQFTRHHILLRMTRWLLIFETHFMTTFIRLFFRTWAIEALHYFQYHICIHITYNYLP